MSDEYRRAGITGALMGIIFFPFACILAFLAFFIPVVGIFAALGCIGAGFIVPIMGAMQIVGPCPYCHRHIGAGQSALKANPGSAFNCPHCKNRILVTKHNPRFIKPGEIDISTGEKTFAEKKERGVLELDEISIERETKKCPMCAETIKLEAKKCRFCNHLFDVDEVENQIEARKREIMMKMAAERAE